MSNTADEKVRAVMGLRVAPRDAPMLDARCQRQAWCRNKGWYAVSGCCDNCDALFVVRVTKEHEKPYHARCSRCGCEAVRGGVWLGDDSEEWPGEGTP